tara:strand:- start:204 stop:557 length:354 start_codon:yes stop_codon:yes gene_type:complete
MLSRPHPCLGWLHITPRDTRYVMDRLLHYRDLELAENPNFTGMPQAFIDWTWAGWLPSNLHRYDEQVRQQIAYLDSKIGRLDQDLKQRAGGVLDARDDAVDLRERLQQQLDARELVT